MSTSRLTAPGRQKFHSGGDAGSSAHSSLAIHLWIPEVCVTKLYDAFWRGNKSVALKRMWFEPTEVLKLTQFSPEDRGSSGSIALMLHHLDLSSVRD
jgi:hypothetical protein